MNIDVIIPCYNEERTIEAVILGSVKHLSLNDNLIIVDDGSTDKSNILIKKLENKFSNINLIKHEKNFGKGAAIQTALKRIKNEIIIIQDADLEYDPSEYKKLINPIIKYKADVVYGSRFVGSGEYRILHFWHSVVNHTLTFLSNIFSNLDLTDMETGFKVFRSEKILKLNLKEKRFGFEPEVTIKLAKQKCIFYEIGISYRGRTYAEGKKIGLLDVFVAVYCIIRYSIFE